MTGSRRYRRIVGALIVLVSVPLVAFGAGAAAGADHPPTAEVDVEVEAKWIAVAGEVSDKPFGFVERSAFLDPASGPLTVYDGDHAAVVGYLVPEVGVLTVEQYDRYEAQSTPSVGVATPEIAPGS